MKVKDVVCNSLRNEIRVIYDNNLYATMTQYQMRILAETADGLAAGKYGAVLSIKGLDDYYDLEVKSYRECRTKYGNFFTRMICLDEKGREIQVNYFQGPRRFVSRWQPESNRR